MNTIVYAGTQRERALALAKQKDIWLLIRRADAGELYIDGRSERYERGDVIAVPPGCECQCTECGGDVYVLIENAALPLRSPNAVREVHGGGFEHAFMQAEYYLSAGGTKNAAVLAALGDLITGYIAAQDGAAALSPIVESVRADILANYADPSYALDAFMRTLPLSGDYVRKLFKSQTGVTPHDYLVGTRMQHAGRLLSGSAGAAGRRNIAQIAEMCGFSEPLYFSRVFKKYYGIPPSDYGKDDNK